MNRKRVSTGLGYGSVACSLAFWVWAGLFLFTPLNRSEGWLRMGAGAGAPYLWFTLWILGLLMGLIAAALGSRGWILAAILAIVSFAVIYFAMSSVQW